MKTFSFPKNDSCDQPLVVDAAKVKAIVNLLQESLQNPKHLPALKDALTALKLREIPKQFLKAKLDWMLDCWKASGQVRDCVIQSLN